MSNHDHSHPHPKINLNSTELRQYLEQNIRHLEEHIKSFTKLQQKIKDNHAIKSLEKAISYLKKGSEELKHTLAHL